jgi:arabinoxylan arabinofuranohydrolase
MKRMIIAVVGLCGMGICRAQMPIVQTIFTADPAPVVHEGVLYLFTGHDEDDTPDERFVMHDYRCFSTTDMVNWTDHGAVLDVREVFDWSGGDASQRQVLLLCQHRQHEGTRRRGSGRGGCG